MISVTAAFKNAQTAAVREVQCYVEEYTAGGELVQTLRPSNYISNWNLSSHAENQMFGKLSTYSFELNLINQDGNLTAPTVGNYLRVKVGYNNEYITYPRFWIFDTAVVDSNRYKITCYDDIALIRFSSYTLADIHYQSSWSLGTVMDRVLALFGLPTYSKRGTIELNSTNWIAGANRLNYEQNTPVIEFIEDFLEINGCSAYMKWASANGDNLRLVRNTASTTANAVADGLVLSLSAGNSRTISGVGLVTTLGDNTLYGDDSQTIVSLLDNGLLDLNSNSDACMQQLLTWVNAFSCSAMELVSRCDLTLEPWDIATSKGCKFVHADYSIVYDGGLRESCSWEFDNQEAYDFNPPSLDNTMRTTTAKVDKVNQQITLQVQNLTDLAGQVANLQIDTQGISGRVSSTEQLINTNKAETDAAIEQLIQQTALAQTAQDVQLLIQQSLQDGVESVTTSTGFTFNQDGLTISKSESDIKTTIDEDGMDIAVGNQKQLEVNHDGVDAINLTAKKYLQIAHARFEHYVGDFEGAPHRTACFYIGGDE